MLKVFAKQIEVAQEIDLDLDSLVYGLQTLEQYGLLQTGRADEIRGIDEAR